jgi:Uma2 family endonuclease
MPVVLEDLDLYLPVTLHKPDLTDQEWQQFCAKYSDYRIEYTAEGDLVLMPGTDPVTGFRNSWITAELLRWSIRDGNGKCCDSSTAFLLPSGARRSPDASWITNDQWQKIVAAKQPIAITPRFVIELKSSQDSRKKLHEKMVEWIENGVELAWAIDPERKQVTIYRPNQMPESVENADSICGEGPVAGFLLDLTLIWNQS